MSARGQQKRKEEKRKKRQQKMARRPPTMSARNQLGKALAAVEQLKQLEGLGDLAPMIQAVHQEVTELRPLLDAVIDDNEVMAKRQETLLKAVAEIAEILPGVSDDTRAQLQAMLQPVDEDAQ